MSLSELAAGGLGQLFRGLYNSIALSGGSMEGGSYWVIVQGSAVCCGAGVIMWSN